MRGRVGRTEGRRCEGDDKNGMGEGEKEERERDRERGWEGVLIRCVLLFLWQ